MELNAERDQKEKDIMGGFELIYPLDENKVENQ